ncbi:MAG: hypothetical protein QM619_07455 [Micropruina sp.]|uniref:hypothetical protein n=1 Tax=Micropruina sp. TaxID=2737536 RepID=UPI0039E390E9
MTIKVGSGTTHAQYRLANVDQVAILLCRLAYCRHWAQPRQADPLKMFHGESCAAGHQYRNA